MPVSPDINNYYVGKGKVYWTPSGGSEIDVGNVPEFEFTPEIDKLDHFSSREGTRTKDRSIVIEKSASVRIVMEEWTPENLANALLGDVLANTAGDEYIEIFSKSEVTGQLRFEGNNDVGPKIDIVLPSVSFIPGSTLGVISDEWGGIELTGDVLAVGGSFGTLTIRDVATA